MCSTESRNNKCLLLPYFISLQLLHVIIVFLVCTQYKRHKIKQHTRNFAKSVVNLVDAVSKLLFPFEKCVVFA